MNSSPSDSLLFLPDRRIQTPSSFLNPDSRGSESTDRGPPRGGFPFGWDDQHHSTSTNSSVSSSSLEGFRFGSQSSSLLSHRSTVSSSSESSSEASSFGSGPSFSFTPPHPHSSTSSTPSSNRSFPCSSLNPRSPSRSGKPLLLLPLQNQTTPVPPSLLGRRGSLPATNAVPFQLPLPAAFDPRRGASTQHGQGAPLAPSSWSWVAKPELQGIPSPLRMEYTSNDRRRGGDDDDDATMVDLDLASPRRYNGSPSPANGMKSNGGGGLGGGGHGVLGRGKAPSSTPYGRGGASRKMSLPTHFSSHSASSSSSSGNNDFTSVPGVSSNALMSRSTFALPYVGQKPLSPESPATQLHPFPPHHYNNNNQHQHQQQNKQPSFSHLLQAKSNSGYPFPQQQQPHTPPATPRSALVGLPPTLQNSSSSSQGSSSLSSTPHPSTAAPPPPSSSSISASLLDGHDLNPLFESRYTLTSSLGSGGYGFVCVAIDHASQKEVAVKFILASKVPPHAWVAYSGNGEEGDGMPPVRGKVPMECEVLRRVKHWGIVEGLGVFCDGKFFYLVQELHGDSWGPSTPETPSTPSLTIPLPLPLNGLGPPSPFAPSFALPASPYIGPSNSFPFPASPITPIRPSINMERRGSCDLFECVERHKKFGEARAKMIFKQIVETVSYLSRIGIYHRDIKDENLVIDREFRVKLIDFGSAVWERDEDQPGRYKEFFGTVAYASPEIITGHHYQAAQAEVWSLGILLCILVTGESPFASPKEAQIGRRSPLRNGLRMSKELADLVDRCLEVRPERRITIAEMRGHRWLGAGRE